MDIFSHALLPYLTGSHFKLDKKLLAAFVLGGIAPDLDFLLIWVNYVYPSNILFVHRGLTHSLIFGFLTALLVLYLASRPMIKNTLRKVVDFDIELSIATIALAYAGVLTHLFLDYLTTRGVPLFYPLYTPRLSANIFYHTEVAIALTSLAVIIWLLKKPRSDEANKKALMAFIVVLLFVGSIRLEGKVLSESFLQDSSTKSYPDAGLFEWTLLKENGDKFEVYGYSALARAEEYNYTFHRYSAFDISKKGDIKGAMRSAEMLPEVKLFRWRAYATVVNASFKDGSWLLEYYDPVIKAEMMNSALPFKTAPDSYAYMKVVVGDDNIAVVEED